MNNFLIICLKESKPHYILYALEEDFPINKLEIINEYNDENTLISKNNIDLSRQLDGSITNEKITRIEDTTEVNYYKVDLNFSIQYNFPVDETVYSICFTQEINNESIEEIITAASFTEEENLFYYGDYTIFTGQSEESEDENNVNIDDESEDYKVVTLINNDGWYSGIIPFDFDYDETGDNAYTLLFTLNNKKHSIELVSNFDEREQQVYSITEKVKLYGNLRTEEQEQIKETVLYLRNFDGLEGSSITILVLLKQSEGQYIRELEGAALISFGRTTGDALENNYGIAINSSDDFHALPARAISLFKTIIHPNELIKVDYDYQGILGTLPELNKFEETSLYSKYLQNTQGIFTDNIYLGDETQYLTFYTDTDDENKKKFKISGANIVFTYADGQGTREVGIAEEIKNELADEGLLDGHFLYYSDTSQTLLTHPSANVVQSIENDPADWGYNVNIGANGIRIRQGEINFSQWTETELTFFYPNSIYWKTGDVEVDNNKTYYIFNGEYQEVENPNNSDIDTYYEYVVSPKAMALKANSLEFYDINSLNQVAYIGAEGLKVEQGYIGNEDNYVKYNKSNDEQDDSLEVKLNQLLVSLGQSDDSYDQEQNVDVIDLISQQVDFINLWTGDVIYHYLLNDNVYTVYSFYDAIKEKYKYFYNENEFRYIKSIDEEIDQAKTYFIHGYIIVDNPIEKDINNYYELVNNEYQKTTDIEIDNAKTYYRFGYVVVDIPDEEELENYYELDKISWKEIESQSNINEFNRYQKTSDVEVDNNKTYYIFNGEYQEVEKPDDFDINNYYELISGEYQKTIDQTVDRTKSYYVRKYIEVENPTTAFITNYYESVVTFTKVAGLANALKFELDAGGGMRTLKVTSGASEEEESVEVKIDTNQLKFYSRDENSIEKISMTINKDKFGISIDGQEQLYMNNSSLLTAVSGYDFGNLKLYKVGKGLGIGVQ